MPSGRKHPPQGERRVVLKGTRMPVQTIFENLEAGLSVKEITEVFDVTEEEVKTVLRFATQSLERAPAHG